MGTKLPLAAVTSKSANAEIIAILLDRPTLPFLLEAVQPHRGKDRLPKSRRGIFSHRLAGLETYADVPTSCPLQIRRLRFC